MSMTERDPLVSALSFPALPAASKQVAILSIVFNTEPLSLLLEFFVFADLPLGTFFDNLLAEELAGVFANVAALDGAVTGGATTAVTTLLGGWTTVLGEFATSRTEVLIVGREGIASVAGTSSSSTPSLIGSVSCRS